MNWILYSYRQDALVPSFPDDKPLFVFDGVCVLCSSGAGWLMRHDKQHLFRFTSAQSPLGQALYMHFGVAMEETYLLLDKGQLFDKSDGYLRMVEILGGWWFFWQIFRLIPRRIRDYFYDVVARNRYKWFGKTECCKLIPDHLAKMMLWGPDPARHSQNGSRHGSVIRIVRPQLIFSLVNEIMDSGGLRGGQMSAGAATADPIKHVIVLMLDNRSFDQMLGAFQEVYPNLDGIPAGQPPRNVANGVSYPQSSGAAYIAPADPNHDYQHVLLQISNGNSGFVQDFVNCFPNSSTADRAEVMKYHARGVLPALHTLAENFTICDHRFSSLPGAHMAQSAVRT